MSRKPSKPETRIEDYLDVMTGGNASLPQPILRIEFYYAFLAGMAVELPQPILDDEKLLAKICGMEVEAPTYIPGISPRLYAYMAKKGGQDVQVPDPILRLECYWYDYSAVSPSSVQEYTGTVPVTFAADGTPLIDYLISGNTVQSGTPTPDNPIIPEGCGDLETSGTKAGQYKIPISSADTTTPVYLGEVETTRRIGKIDLGTLNWTKTASGNFNAATTIPNIRTISNLSTGNAICDMFKEVTPNAVANEPYSFSSCLNTAGRPFINRTGFEELTAEEFKQAMSGVYMYYVLAEHEIAVVNEPLMRIGDHADTLSMEQAGVQIPTANGSTTLDVETTVKPSEVYIKYRGEAVATLSALPAEVSSQEAITEEGNPEETEEEENER